MSDTEENETPSSPYVTSIDDLSPAAQALLANRAAPEQEQEEVEAAESAPEPEPEAEEEAAAGQSQPQNTERFTEAFERLVAERAELAKQREEHAAQIATLQRVRDARNHYDDDRISVIRDYLGALLGTEDDAIITGELEEVYEDLTRQKLGLAVDSTAVAKRETAKLRREFESLKREKQKAEEQAERQRLEKEHQAAVNNALSQIGGFLEAGKDSHRFLMLEDNPAYVVWDVIATHYRDTGEEMTVADAAQRAETHFKQQATKYKQLLTEAQPTREPEKQRPVKQQKTSLTNAIASSEATATPDVHYDDPDEAKLAVIRKHLSKR